MDLSNLKNIITADSSPYPEIKVQEKNKKLAEQMNFLFGGGAGELGAISDYIYQGIIFKDSFPEYAEIFMKIAKVEMHHLFMMGQLIHLLGGELIFGSYSGGKPAYWSGKSINYTSDIASALIYDLNEEQRAYSAYVSFARQAGDRYVFAVLTRIALDEMIHASLFKTLISSLKKTN